MTEYTARYGNFPGLMTCWNNFQIKRISFQWGSMLQNSVSPRRCPCVQNRAPSGPLWPLGRMSTLHLRPPRSSPSVCLSRCWFSCRGQGAPPDKEGAETVTSSLQTVATTRTGHPQNPKNSYIFSAEHRYEGSETIVKNIFSVQRNSV